MSLNQVTLIGHLGKAPEVLKTSKKGVFVALSLATNKTYIGSDGAVKKDTQWHSIYVSNNRGKAAVEHLRKGSRVYIHGELRYREIQDSEGKKRYLGGVYAQKIIFLDNKADDKAEVHASSLEEAEVCTTEVVDGDFITTE